MEAEGQKIVALAGNLCAGVGGEVCRYRCIARTNGR